MCKQMTDVGLWQLCSSAWNYLNVCITAQLKFVFTYFKDTVQHFGYYITRTHPLDKKSQYYNSHSASMEQAPFQTVPLAATVAGVAYFA